MAARTVSGRSARLERTRRACEADFSRFVKLMFHVVCPGRTLVWTWFMQAVCDHMEALYRGDCKGLLIAIPPGHSKTLIVSILFPCWVWLQEGAANQSFLFGSHTYRLSIDISEDRRRVLDSPLYNRMFRPKWKRLKGSWQKQKLQNTHGGQLRITTTLRSGALGTHFDYIILDDPAQPHWAFSPLLQQVNDTYNSSIKTRAKNATELKTVVVAQRLGQDDLIGHLLKSGGDFEYLCLPAMYDPEHTTPPTCIGFEDPRTERLQLLSPARHPRDFLEHFKSEKGTGVFMSQYQQRPQAAGYGKIFNTEWWQHYQVDPDTGLPAGVVIEEFVTTIDSAFGTASDTADFTCVMTVGRAGNRVYLMPGYLHGRYSYTELMDLLLGPTVKGAHTGGGYVERWGACQRYQIEQASNGGAICSSLQRAMGSSAHVEIIDPRGKGGSKLAKAVSVSPYVEGKFVYLPPLDSPGVKELIEEAARFTGSGGGHDDRVDALRMALQHFGARIGIGAWVPEAPSKRDQGNRVPQHRPVPVSGQKWADRLRRRRGGNGRNSGR